MARKFYFNWKVSLFALVCVVTFVRLGFWQLDRESEKRVYLAEREARASQAPVMADRLPETGELAGTHVQLNGRYDEDITLLRDNVVLDGRVGFEVYQLFVDSSGRDFVVNRGFVPMGRTRQDPVNIPSVGDSHCDIKGEVYTGTGTPVVLGDAAPVSATYPRIVQLVDIARLSESLDRTIYPFVIRLDENQQGALPRYWPDTVMSPEKHFGYAIQWFTMTLAVLVVWTFFSFRKEEAM